MIGGGGGKQEQWCTLLAFLCRNKVSACSDSMLTKMINNALFKINSFYMVQSWFKAILR